MRIKIVLLRIPAILSAILFFLYPVKSSFALELSAAEKSYLKNKGTIVFVSQTRYPPFEFVDKNGEHTGMCIELARWMATELGFTARFTDTSFHQAQLNILSKKADVLTSFFYSKKRDKLFDFTQTMFFVPASIFVPAERTDIKDINDLKGKVIAMQKGDYAREFLESKNIVFNLIDTKNFADATDLVIANKADAVIGDEQIVLYHIFKNRLTDKIKKVGKPLYIGKNCMATGKSNRELINILKKGIQKAQQKGVLEKINQKWLGTPYKFQESFFLKYKYHLISIFILLFVMALSVWFFNIRLRKAVYLRTGELEESEKRYRTLTNNLNVGVYRNTPGPKGKFLEANPAMLKLFRYNRRQDFFDINVSDLYKNPEDRVRFNSKILKDGAVINIEEELVKKDGTSFVGSISAVAVKNKKGEIIYYDGIIEDITERKKTQNRIEQLNRLRENLLIYGSLKEKLKLITNGIVEIFKADFARIWLIKPGDLCESDCMHAGITEGPHVCRHREKCLHLVSSSGRYTHTDGNHRRVPFGCYKIGRVAASKDAKFLTNDAIHDPRIHDHEWAKKLGLVSFAGYRILSPEAKVKGVMALFSRYAISPEEDGLLEDLAHTTAQVIQAAISEENLRESEKRFRQLAEMLPETVFEIDAQGKIIFVNRNAFGKFGYTPRDIKDGLNGFEILIPEDRQRAMENTQKVLGGKQLGLIEYTGLKKDGTTFPVLIHAIPIYSKGKAVGLRGIIIDITETKRLESQLQQAQKMESIGTLAGGIAHDFNNLLMGILGRTSLMLMDKDSSNPDFDHLKGIEDYAKSASELTKQLLGFARGGKYEVKPTDINKLVKTQNRMFGRTKKEITIRGKYEKNLWAADVDPGQIEQVLLNLYVNAWQAMPGGGNLYIQTENVTIDENYVKPYQVIPGKYVKISVTDTGTGMDDKTLERIFDPFFTTKDRERGTGLGLASAYGIIKNHNGFINVYSEPGEGTTFNIYLPASGKKVIDEKSDGGNDIKGGNETVLLVDDEEMITDVGKQMLKRLGYGVMTAGTGAKAIEIYNTNKTSIDLVILDMIMPDMGGGETYNALKKINPDLKALLSSGYSINGQAQEILNRGCNGFIQKPFNMNDLSQKIRDILDKT